MGLVLIGAFAFTELAMQGVVIQMLSHGLSTGALFILVALLQERIHTRDMNVMGGLWESVQRMGAMGLIFAMASLGLPGFGNFVAEFLILVGLFKTTVVWAVQATLGLVASTIYSLMIVQRVFHGKHEKEWKIEDFNVREMFVMASLVVTLVINSTIGLFYYLRIIVAMFSKEAEGEKKKGGPAYLPLGGSIVLAVLLILLLWFGIFPADIMIIIQKLVAGLGYASLM